MFAKPVPGVVRVSSRRLFSTSPVHTYPGFLDLGARAVSRENIHFSRQSGATGDKYVNHSPALELLRSERDLAEGRKSNSSTNADEEARKRKLATGYDVFNHEELQRQGVVFPEEVSPISDTTADAAVPNISAEQGEGALDVRILRAQLTKLEHQVQSLAQQNKKYRSERNRYRTRRFFSSALVYFCTGVLISCFFVLDQKTPLNVNWLWTGTNSTDEIRKKKTGGPNNSETRLGSASMRKVEVVPQIKQDLTGSVQAPNLNKDTNLPATEATDALPTSTSRLRRLFWKD